MRVTRRVSGSTTLRQELQMLHDSSILRTATGLAVAALIAQPLAGCSGASQAIPGGNASQFRQVANPFTSVRPDIQDGDHVTSLSGNCIVTYAYNPVKGIWEYTYNPPGCDPAEGIFTGLAHATATNAWFVGQSTASVNDIGVYNDKGKQVGTLTGLTGNPIGIATDSKADVWATNSPSNTISEYNPGATTPSATYTDKSLSSLRYITVDKNDNVYVSGQSQASGSLEVDELQGSAFSPIKTITGTTGAGIVVAPTGKTLWVCDEGDGSKGTISGYTIPGFKRMQQIAYSGDDTGIAVALSGKELYAIDNVANGSEFNVSVVIYNAKTGKLVRSSNSITTAAKDGGIATRR